MPSLSFFRTRVLLLLLWAATTACHGLVVPDIEGMDGGRTCDETGSSQRVCTSGDTRCSATTNGVETCDTTGHWRPAAACVAQTCVAAETTASCRGVCAYGDTRCANATHVQTCNARGAWGDPVVCANAACLAGALPTPRCGGTCTPGETRCSNDNVETCSATGSWQTTQACVDQTCIKSQEGQTQCQGVCAPGQTQCSNNAQQTCSASGQWAAPAACVNQTCLGAARSGSCQGVCAPGQTRCSNNGFQSCASGQWRGPIADISAGQGKVFSSSVVPSALIDTVARKLLVVTLALNNSRNLGLVRCDLDGSACVYADIFAGPSFGGFSAVIDVAGSKLLVVTRDNTSKPVLIRCNLDGSACTYTDISAGQGANISIEPSVIIDAARGKLLVVTRNEANSNRPGLLRCNLDGSACAYADISAGQGGTSGYSPSAVVDATNGKLLVVTRNDANLGKPGLFRCDLDGSACAYTDISAGEGTDSGWFPHAFIDTVSRKLLVITSNRANSAKPALFRCNLDGSACAYTDISAGKDYLISNFSAVIDAAAGKLLVLTDAYPSYKALESVRCDLDGSGCTYIEIPAGDFLYSPSAVINPSGGLLVAMGGYSALALFNVCF
jgi:hypothetical protein